MATRVCLVLGLLLVAASWACGGEKPTPPAEREIKALIDQLVSPNPRPITDERPRDLLLPRLPKGFDRARQKKVHEAYWKLNRIGPRAFPFLMERWGDKRYCLTTQDGLSGACYNRTVGYVCKWIVFNQLQPCGFWPKVEDDPRGKPRRPGYPSKFLRSQAAARMWWQKNKDRSLQQMQLEALDWVIAEEAKRPRDFTDAERKELQQIRKKLVKGRQPLPPGNYWSQDIGWEGGGP
jgi:hypothetical protein